MQIRIETFTLCKTSKLNNHRQCDGETVVWATSVSRAELSSVLIFRGGLLLHCDLINIDTVH